MDKGDIKIIEILKKDSRTKYVKIARAVNLTEGAVRRRVKKLVEQGVITKFTIETRVDVEGVVLVRTDPTETRDVALQIKGISDKVFEVSGDYDIAALIQVQTMDELNSKVDRIRKLPSVWNTNTLIRLTTD